MAADTLTDRYLLAADLVVEAGLLALSMQQALGQIDAKHPLDFVTAADRAVETLIRDRLSTRFGDAVIGEEFGGVAGDSLWLVDPIDGTNGYIHGTDRWCVSLAYVLRGRIEIGLIYAPVPQRLYSARLGQGAFRNGRPIRVSGMAHGTAPVIETGWSARRPLPAYTQMLARFVDGGMEFRRHGSGALGLADVAAGLNDGYVEMHINAWDVLAGILLVQEAGGWTNDFLAGDGLHHGNPIIACTPEIREQLLVLIAP